MNSNSPAGGGWPNIPLASTQLAADEAWATRVPRAGREVDAVSIVALWLPIVVSAVFVFIVSSVMHMLLPLHKSDFKMLPAEDEVMEALRRFNIPAGDYMMPCPGGMEQMRSPEHKAKLVRGPVAVMTIFGANHMNMGASLGQWFARYLFDGLVYGLVTAGTFGWLWPK